EAQLGLGGVAGGGAFGFGVLRFADEDDAAVEVAVAEEVGNLCELGGAGAVGDDLAVVELGLVEVVDEVVDDVAAAVEIGREQAGAAVVGFGLFAGAGAAGVAGVDGELEDVVGV